MPLRMAICKGGTLAKTGKTHSLAAEDARREKVAGSRDGGCAGSTRKVGDVYRSCLSCGQGLLAASDSVKPSAAFADRQSNFMLQQQRLLRAVMDLIAHIKRVPKLDGVQDDIALVADFEDLPIHYFSVPDQPCQKLADGGDCLNPGRTQVQAQFPLRVF